MAGSRRSKSAARARWQLTRAAEEMLGAGARRIYSFTGPDADWDGRWLLLYARAPEKDRRARHLLRSRLSWAGFGTLGPRLWVSTHPNGSRGRTGPPRRRRRRGGPPFVATRPGVGDLRTMVSEAWDLDAIQAAYEGFLDKFGVPRSDPVLPPADRPGACVATLSGRRPFPAPGAAAGPMEWWRGGAPLCPPPRPVDGGGQRAEWLRLNAGED